MGRVSQTTIIMTNTNTTTTTTTITTDRHTTNRATKDLLRDLLGDSTHRPEAVTTSMFPLLTVFRFSTKATCQRCTSRRFLHGLYGARRRHQVATGSLPQRTCTIMDRLGTGCITTNHTTGALPICLRLRRTRRAAL
jgi:hypothetical protein